MPNTTGIEIGPNSCVLTAVRVGRRGAAIVALHVIAPADWPAQDLALAELLRSVRRRKKLPRAAHVVAWGLPGVGAEDPRSRAVLEPLVAAGFRVDALSGPVQALARLADRDARTGEGAVAWLALNRSGVAIAIVRGHELLFSREFAWSFNQGQAGSRAELLQRYCLVSHLAPEVQRGIAMVLASHGVAVETVVTCGDLPDLRSLTMPLIEELDLEVETLDSVEGLPAGGSMKTERLSELAPMIRLACSAATAPSQRRRAAPLVAVAASTILVAGLGWGAYTYWAPSPMESPPTAAGPLAPPPIVPADAAPRPAPSSASDIEGTSRATMGTTPPSPARSVDREPQSLPLVTKDPLARPQQPEPDSADAQRVLSPTPDAAAARNRAPRARPAPLREPMPVVDSILVDQYRQLAVVSGVIVSVGDRVGSRTITQIGRGFVILEEPSGLKVRVAVLGKQSGVRP